MVDEDTIREENLEPSDVLDQLTETPMDGVEWIPEWDDSPEAQPGENTRIEDDVLKWERDGFAVELESYETTHWKVEIDIPEDVGQYYPREFDLKCAKKPEYGFVESVETEEYFTTHATLILQDNFMPVWEVNAFIDMLLESKESSEEFREEIETKMAVARENQ